MTFNENIVFKKIGSISINNLIYSFLALVLLVDLMFEQVTVSIIPIFSRFSILGRPFSLYLHYFIWFISLILFAKKCVSEKITIWEIIFLFAIIFTYTLSFFEARDTSLIIEESGQFFFPLFLYYYIFYSRISYKSILYGLIITVVFCGILSLLIGTRVIETNIWAAKDDYVRSAGFVDGTCGLVGFMTSLILLSNKNCEYSTVLSIAGLIGSSLVILFGFSRLRVMILIVCITLFIVMRQSTNGGKKQSSRKYFVFFISTVIILLLIQRGQNVFDTFERMFLNRFNRIGSDSGTSFRIDEMKTHLDLFAQTYGAGIGWGLRSTLLIGTNTVRAHIVYSAILMHFGIFFGGAYILFLIKLLIDAIKQYMKSMSTENQIEIIICIILILSGFGGGGITQEGALYIMSMIFARKVRLNAELSKIKSIECL